MQASSISVRSSSGVTSFGSRDTGEPGTVNADGAATSHLGALNVATQGNETPDGMEDLNSGRTRSNEAEHSMSATRP